MAILDMKIFCGCDFEHENFCCWSWQNFGGTLIFGHGKFLSWNEIFVFVVGMGFFRCDFVHVGIFYGHFGHVGKTLTVILDM